MRIYPSKTLRQIVLILMLFVLGWPGGLAASELKDDIQKCTREQAALKRLDCYDRLAEKFNLVTKFDYINPPEEFLSSKVTVTPWTYDYRLTVEGLVKLIENAVMADGEKIEIHGWTRQGRDYVLNITMRRPMRLKFLPFETATDDIPLSLLRKLVVDGEATDPELFITTIASMVPDEKIREPQ